MERNSEDIDRSIQSIQGSLDVGKQTRITLRKTRIEQTRANRAKSLIADDGILKS